MKVYAGSIDSRVPPPLLKASELKVTHSLSLANAQIGAYAMMKGALSVLRDPKFSNLHCARLKLPMKD